MSTPKIILRPVRDDDIALFCASERDPLARHMAAFTAVAQEDDAACRARWARHRSNPDILIRAIVVEETGAVTGSVVSFAQDGAREVSYWLARAWWGRGIASTALQLFLKEEQTRPLYARVACDNVASLRVLRKSGFVVIGQERGFATARGVEVDEYVLVLSGA
jgi:RimJ/RimL family protein N-acetyltransferase